MIQPGILVYRQNQLTGHLEVLLGKCGGPAWEKFNVGAWNVPKGEALEHEDHKTAAIREFCEETGFDLSSYADRFIDLGISETPTKRVHIFAVELDLLHDFNIFKVQIKSNTCTTEYPVNSGNYITVPELSDAYYFNIETAKRLIFPNQLVFLSRLKERRNK